MILVDRNFGPGEEIFARGKVLREKQTIARTPRRAAWAAWGAPGLGIQERMCTAPRWNKVKNCEVHCCTAVQCNNLKYVLVQAHAF